MTTATWARITSGLLATVGVFQAGLAGGLPWGRASYGGAHHGVLPRRLRTLKRRGSGRVCRARRGRRINRQQPHGAATPPDGGQRSDGPVHRAQRRLEIALGALVGPGVCGHLCGRVAG